MEIQSSGLYSTEAHKSSFHTRQQGGGSDQNILTLGGLEYWRAGHGVPRTEMYGLIAKILTCIIRESPGLMNRNVT